MTIARDWKSSGQKDSKAVVRNPTNPPSKPLFDHSTRMKQVRRSYHWTTNYSSAGKSRKWQKVISPATYSRPRYHILL